MLAMFESSSSGTELSVFHLRMDEALSILCFVFFIQCELCFKSMKESLGLLLSLGEFGIECLFQVNQTLIKLVTRNFL